MQNLRASMLRFANVANVFAGTRNLCNLAKPAIIQLNGNGRILQASAAFNVKSLTCNAHTKAETELAEFLTEEIYAERKVQKQRTVPATLKGFAVKLNGAEVQLIKDSASEKIRVTFNVNNSVDTNEDIAENENEAAMTNLTSSPEFKVEIMRGNTTLAFQCSIFQEDGGSQESEYEELFGINELCIYEHECNEKVFAASSSVLDNYMYNLLLSLLEEKGINNEFASKLSELATTHEHNLYVDLLEQLSKFTAGKIQ